MEYVPLRVVHARLREVEIETRANRGGTEEVREGERGEGLGAQGPRGRPTHLVRCQCRRCRAASSQFLLPFGDIDRVQRSAHS